MDIDLATTYWRRGEIFCGWVSRNYSVITIYDTKHENWSLPCPGILRWPTCRKSAVWINVSMRFAAWICDFDFLYNNADFLQGHWIPNFLIASLLDSHYCWILPVHNFNKIFFTNSFFLHTLTWVCISSQFWFWKAATQPDAGKAGQSHRRNRQLHAGWRSHLR